MDDNVMRHAYRVLSDDEKAAMQSIKDQGLKLFEMIGALGQSHQIDVAQDRVEEAVMWAVKHITA